MTMHYPIRENARSYFDRSTAFAFIEFRREGDAEDAYYDM